MSVAPSEVSRHDACVLAYLLVQAVEVFSTRTGESYASIGRRARLPRGYVDKLRAAVHAKPAHVITSDVAERLADAIGYEVTLTPKGDAS